MIQAWLILNKVWIQFTSSIWLFTEVDGRLSELSPLKSDFPCWKLTSKNCSDFGSGSSCRMAWHIRKKHLTRADHGIFNYLTYGTAEAQPDYSWRCTLRCVGPWKYVTSEMLTLCLKNNSQRGKSSTGTSVYKWHGISILANILNKPWATFTRISKCMMKSKTKNPRTLGTRLNHIIFFNNQIQPNISCSLD